MKRDSIRLLAIPLARWPGKLTALASRWVWETGEGTLTRLRLINRRADRLDSALGQAYAEREIPGLVRRALRERFFVIPNDRSEVLAALEEIVPMTGDSIVAEADRICDHFFDLLGSAPTPLSETIDWHVDFKTGHRWNPKTYYKRIRPAPYPGGYDIKVPWELSRCQHLVRLGQAYWITGDERYAGEFVVQIEDWIRSNPWPLGVNWACTMDVAIRAVNWLWGLALLADSPILTDVFLIQVARSLLLHGRHILRNLERSEGLTTNHYLANLVGLIFLGILLPELKEATHWREFGLQELENEIFKQVHPDGSDFEASTSYHRLAAELFLAAVVLGQLNGHAFAEPFLKRLEKMLEFTMHVTKPDGTVPLVGDNDNGRLHRLKVWGDHLREWCDHRYLLAIGAVLFERDDFGCAAGDQWEEAFWLLGERAASYKEELERKGRCAPALPSRAFADAGVYIMRDDDAYMLIDGGGTGQGGVGGHAHNDVFSFELCAAGHTWLLDPGSVAYTGDYRARNSYRSSSAHNVLVVDGEEINVIRERDLFELRDQALPLVLRWEATSEYDVFHGRHAGYRRLAEPVSCERVVFFSKRHRFWMLGDCIEGSGLHHLELWFHFAPQLTLRLLDTEPPIALASLDEQRCLALHMPSGWMARIFSGSYAPGYGVQVSAPVVCCSAERVRAGQSFTFFLALETPDSGMNVTAMSKVASRFLHG
jgi:hypothetical protein